METMSNIIRFGQPLCNNARSTLISKDFNSPH